jgi:hypothetical protein
VPGAAARGAIVRSRVPERQERPGAMTRAVKRPVAMMRAVKHPVAMKPSAMKDAATRAGAPAHARRRAEGDQVLRAAAGPAVPLKRAVDSNR